MNREALEALLMTLPADRQVDVRDGSVWIICPSPEHSGGNERTPSFKITTTENEYFGSHFCFGCGIKGPLKSKNGCVGTLERLGLSISSGLHTNEPYDLFSESEEAHLMGKGDKLIVMPPTEDWPDGADWRGVNHKLVQAVGGRMQIAGDGREPLLILPVVMRGKMRGYVKCRCIPRNDGFNYVNAGSNWSRDALFPYDYIKRLLDESDGERMVAIVEGCRDALVTIQNGLPALATLGATSWSSKCATAVRLLGIGTVICLADPDDAGDLLANRVYNDLHDRLTVKVIRLPSKMIQTEHGPRRVKVLDAADLSRAQLATVLVKAGIPARANRVN